MLNESIVEDAALAIAKAALIPAICLRLSPLRSGFQREKERLREAIRRLNSEIFSLSFGLLLHLAVAGLTKLLIREVSGAETLFKSL